MTVKLDYGPRLTETGAQFRVRSRHATRIDLCLFENGKEHRHTLNRTGEDRHELHLSGIKPGQLYGLRADGPWDEAQGHRFDVSKLLLDPCATGISHHAVWHEELAQRGINTAALTPKSVLHTPMPALQPLPPHRPQFIYEIPVKAFTKLHPEIPPQQRGTLAALAHPTILEHLKKIGCDTVEVMPVAAWTDERHLARTGLRNAWGYNPVSFFAPEPAIVPGGIAELRDTVRVLHENGMRVILDVVFNHTGESDFDGGTFSLRGLDNATYFRLDRGHLINDTGCGNTLALDQPACIDLVISALRHWVLNCGIDGFRYDLATIMGRTASGFSPTAPLLEAIQSDPVLGELIHIAEPWDIGPGGYQLGNFPANWLEWNDHYRDDTRRFWRGDAGAHRNFATRLAGSSDIFNRNGRKPSSSVNFVAAHDGFALADVARFARKQNHANGENNRDGSDAEISWTSPTPDDAVRAMLASLIFSRGTMMLTAGDEMGRSQRGNNNAYAQDNETTWLDWRSADDTLCRYLSHLVSLRRSMGGYFPDEFLTGRPEPDQSDPDVLWFGEDGQELTAENWRADHIQTLGVMLTSKTTPARLALTFSVTAKTRPALPAPHAGMAWQEISTALPMSHVAVFHERNAKRATN